MREAQAGIKELKAFDDPNALARAWRLVSLVYGVSGRYEACGDANEKAIEYARRAGDRVTEKRLYATASLVLVLGPTPAQKGIAGCESLIQMRRGRPPRASRHVRRSRPPARDGRGLRAGTRGLPSCARDPRGGRPALRRAFISIDSGPVELLAGDPVAAEAELRKDYEALDAMGERNYISSIAGLLAEALYRQGQFEDARAHAAFCEEVAAPSDVSSQYLWRGVKGKLLARDGDHDAGITSRDFGCRPGPDDGRHRGAGQRVDVPGRGAGGGRSGRDAGLLCRRGTRDVRGQGQRRVGGPGRRVRLARRGAQCSVPGHEAHRVGPDDDQRKTGQV